MVVSSPGAARTPSSALGVVVIGLNASATLPACLAALPPGAHVVYVDRGSADDSCAVASAHGALVTQLAAQPKPTRAAARNAGLQHLLTREPALTLVQTLDADGVLVGSWLLRAQAFLRQRPDVVAAAGRRRERHPHTSVWHRLREIDDGGAVGEAQVLGGQMLVRVSAWRSVGGFDDALPTAEAAEFSQRLCASGGRLWRLDHDMVWHDAKRPALAAALCQWWRHQVALGRVMAQGIRTPETDRFGGGLRRALLWGAVLPLACVLLGVLAHPLWLAWWVAYPAQAMRLVWQLPPTGDETPWAAAALLALACFPQAVGAIAYGLLGNRRRAVATP